MIKSQLMAILASKLSHLPEDKVKKAVKCIIDTMANTLAEGQRIEIRNFGAFAIKQTKERQTRNPKNGEKFLTPPTLKVHFKPGIELKERVNASRNKIKE